MLSERSQWLTVAPVVGGLGLLAYVTYRAYTKKPRVNLSVQKEDPKVVTVVDIEEMGDKVCYCRCWRSKNFPYCDGSHNKHNDETGDNVGPLVLNKKQQSAQ